MLTKLLAPLDDTTRTGRLLMALILGLGLAAAPTLPMLNNIALADVEADDVDDVDDADDADEADDAGGSGNGGNNNDGDGIVNSQ